MARLASAIARMRAAMLQGDAAGEQEQYERRETLTDRMQRDATQRAVFAQQNQAREDAQTARKDELAARLADAAENRALQEAFRRDQLDQSGRLTQAQIDAQNERAREQRALQERLAGDAAQLRRDLFQGRGSAGGAGGAAGPSASGMAPPDASGERLLRSEFEKEVGPHRDIARGFQTVRSSAAIGTPQGDLALMYGLVRMFDPGSVVREGEMATLRSSNSIPQSLRAELSRYIGDGRELPPEVRQRLVQVADRLAADQRAAFRKTAEQAALRNMRYGIPSEAIISDPYSSVMGNDVGNLSGRATGAAAKIKRALGGQP